MSLKTFLAHLWEAISSIFEHAAKEVKEVALPIVISAISGLKDAVDNEITGNIIEAIIYKFGIDIDHDKLAASLSKIVTELHLIQDCAGAGDTNAIISCALAKLKLSTNDAQDAFYHSIAALLLKDLSDGKLSWSECVELVEFYYKNKPTTTA